MGPGYGYSGPMYGPEQNWWNAQYNQSAAYPTYPHYLQGWASNPHTPHYGYQPDQGYHNARGYYGSPHEYYQDRYHAPMPYPPYSPGYLPPHFAPDHGAYFQPNYFYPPHETKQPYGMPYSKHRNFTTGQIPNPMSFSSQPPQHLPRESFQKSYETRESSRPHHRQPSQTPAHKYDELGLPQNAMAEFIKKHNTQSQSMTRLGQNSSLPPKPPAPISWLSRSTSLQSMPQAGMANNEHNIEARQIYDNGPQWARKPSRSPTKNQESTATLRNAGPQRGAETNNNPDFDLGTVEAADQFMADLSKRAKEKKTKKNNSAGSAEGTQTQVKQQPSELEEVTRGLEEVKIKTGFGGDATGDSRGSGETQGVKDCDGQGNPKPAVETGKGSNTGRERKGTSQLNANARTFIPSFPVYEMPRLGDSSSEILAGRKDGKEEYFGFIRPALLPHLGAGETLLLGNGGIMGDMVVVVEGMEKFHKKGKKMWRDIEADLAGVMERGVCVVGGKDVVGGERGKNSVPRAVGGNENAGKMEGGKAKGKKKYKRKQRKQNEALAVNGVGNRCGNGNAYVM
ncbi:hypothetical protein ABW19_dt0200637 [Dactylella cylindrospora]|nr:hypothetical protein ABW19_dt0200637 [Dactylella cylindrospora]